MIYLTSLQVWSRQRKVTGDELRGMLALCPSLTNIVISPIYSIQNPPQLAQVIAPYTLLKVDNRTEGAFYRPQYELGVDDQDPEGIIRTAGSEILLP